MTIRIEEAGERGDPCPWIYDVLDAAGRPLPGGWNGWFASREEALADALAWLLDQSLLSASL